VGGFSNLCRKFKWLFNFADRRCVCDQHHRPASHTAGVCASKGKAPRTQTASDWGARNVVTGYNIGVGYNGFAKDILMESALQHTTYSETAPASA